MSTNSKIHFVVVQSKHFMESKSIIYVMPFLLTLITLVQFLSFALWGGEVATNSGNITSLHKDAWLGWMIISFTFVASVVGITGTIMGARRNPNFILLTLTSVVVSIVLNVLVGYYVNIISNLVILVPSILQWLNWKNKIKIEGEVKITSLGMKNFLLIALATFLFTLFLAGVLFGSTYLHDKEEFSKLTDKDITKMVLQTIGTATLTAGVITIIFSHWEAFIFFVLTDLSFLILFALTDGQWVTTVASFLWLTLTAASLLYWYGLYYESKHLIKIVK